MRVRPMSPVSAALAVCGLAGLLLAALAAPAGASGAATYACTNPVSGTQTYTASIHAVPSALSYKPGSTSVALTGFQVTLTIPASVVAMAESFGVTSVKGKVTNFTMTESFGVTSVKGKVTNFTMTVSDASPASRNVAGTGFTVPLTSLPRPPKNLSVKFPAAPVTIKGWKAGTKAGTIAFRTGPVALSISDTSGDTLPVSCKPSPAATIATAKVL